MYRYRHERIGVCRSERKGAWGRKIQEKNDRNGCQRSVPAVPSRMFRTAEKGSYRFNSPGKAMGESRATRAFLGLSFVRAARGMDFFLCDARIFRIYTYLQYIEYIVYMCVCVIFLLSHIRHRECRDKN